MPADARKTIRFVRRLVSGGKGMRTEAGFAIIGHETIRLSATAVAGLQSQGVLAGDRQACWANGETKTWLRRQLSSTDAYQAQHGVGARGQDKPDGDNPFARLAAGSGDTAPFLAAHHLAAGQRLAHLVERSQLTPRVTMTYSPAYVMARNRGAGPGTEPADGALDARRKLNALLAHLPRDCSGVLLDIVAFGKGLQLIEQERGWPRRSAKLVMRIGLDHIAEAMGLGPVASGGERARPRAWLDQGARPTVLVETEEGL